MRRDAVGTRLALLDDHDPDDEAVAFPAEVGLERPLVRDALLGVVNESDDRVTVRMRAVALDIDDQLLSDLGRAESGACLIRPRLGEGRVVGSAPRRSACRSALHFRASRITTLTP